MYNPITVIETTARNAQGTPASLPFSAGSVMTNAAAAMAMTALNGTPSLLTLDRALEGACPNARSRENAKHIREALVRHARPQNNWPMVEIASTALNAEELRDDAKTSSD